MKTLFPDGEIVEITVRRKKKVDSNMCLSHTRVVSTTEANALRYQEDPIGIMKYERELGLLLQGKKVERNVYAATTVVISIEKEKRVKTTTRTMKKK